MIAVAGALGALLAVAAGAFGAHGLRGQLDASALATWATAADYQMYHSLALLALGPGCAPAARPRRHAGAALCFGAGIVLFSGSLYALALGAPRALGMVTPFGGALFLCGWVLVAVGAWRERG